MFASFNISWLKNKKNSTIIATTKTQVRINRLTVLFFANGRVPCFGASPVVSDFHLTIKDMWLRLSWILRRLPISLVFPAWLMQVLPLCATLQNLLLIWKCVRNILTLKSNLHNNRGITTKLVTSGGVHISVAKRLLRNTAPKKHRSGGKPIGDSVSNFNGPWIEPQTFRTNGNVFTQLS